MLKITDLVSGYEEMRVLHGISLSLSQGEFASVLGPNGAGKTTLLATIFGLLPVMEGRIEWAGEVISGLKSSQVVRRGVSLVPQGRQIFGPLTVERNLELGGLVAGHAFHKPVARRQLELVYSLFPRLAERANQRAGTMSGGEQQMLAIGRALMSDPRVLLLDEPSLGLAPLIVQNILQVLDELRRLGMTIMLVEQNVSLALEQSDSVYVLSLGEIVLQDSAENLRKKSDLSALYLGKGRRQAHEIVS